MTKRFLHPGNIVATEPTVTVRGGDLYAWGGQVGVATVDSDPTGVAISPGTGQPAPVAVHQQIALEGVHLVTAAAAFAPTDGQQVFATVAAGVAEAAATGPRFVGYAIVLSAGLQQRSYGDIPAHPVAGKKYVIVRLAGAAQATF